MLVLAMAAASAVIWLDDLIYFEQAID